MCAKHLKDLSPRRILVVSQTNIGDVILTCPVIDILRRDFPEAKIDVVIGPKAVSLFEGHPDLCVKVFNKQAPLRQKCAWFCDLYHEYYDCVIDLRRTALAFFLAPRYATPLLFEKQTLDRHKKDMHLRRLRQVYEFQTVSDKPYAIQTLREDELFFESSVAPALGGQPFVVIAPGAADAGKRWQNPEGFAAVAEHLSMDAKVIFVGDAKDAEIVADIQRRMKSDSLSLAGKINLRQLAYVLKKCSWALTHDSGVMHLACYFNIPVVVLWGPTDIHRYAPWSQKAVVVRRNEKCPRCQDPKGKEGHNCMSFIEVKDIIEATQNLNKILHFPPPCGEGKGGGNIAVP